MGTNPKGCFLGGMGRRSFWLFFKVGRWDFFYFPRNYSFWWCGMGCLEKMDVYVFFLAFFLLQYGDSMKIFFQKYFIIYFRGNGKF
jgi:hypothetical protein